MAGVSKATVSMVINNKDESISKDTRDKILKICDEMNYVPNSIARSLNTQKTETIGIIVPDITNPFFSEICRAIEDAANCRKYNIFLCNTDNKALKEKEYLELLIGKLVDGVILISHSNKNDSMKILKNNNIPFLLLDRYISSSEGYYGVFCDEKKGIREAIKYLYYKKNRRKIAFVTGNIGLEISRRRFETFKDEATKLNIYNEKIVKYGDFTLESGIRTTKELIDSCEEFDGIIYSNDLMAFGGIKTLIKSGINIPEEVNIIGHDNINFSSVFEPELTTISQPIYEIGKKSCNMLIDIIEGVTIKNKQVILDTKLIIRDT